MVKTQRSPQTKTKVESKSTETMDLKFDEIQAQIKASSNQTIQQMEEMMENFFSKQRDSFEAEMKTFKADITSQIEKFESKIDQMVSAEVEKRMTPVISRLDAAEKRVTDLEQILKSKQQEEDLLQRAKNVIITGIPSSENENLRNVITTITAKLGFSQPPSHAARRFPSKDQNKSMISMKFYTVQDKSNFMNAYFKVAPQLVLKAITGKVSDSSRIYINHDLTKDQYEIHRAAMKLKKEEKLTTVKVINGRIAVSTGTNNKPSFIDTIQQLHQLIA